MTHEPRERAGRPRSDAATRLAELLAEFDRTPTPRPTDRAAEPEPNGQPVPARPRGRVVHRPRKAPPVAPPSPVAPPPAEEPPADATEAAAPPAPPIVLPSPVVPPPAEEPPADATEAPASPVPPAPPVPPFAGPAAPPAPVVAAAASTGPTELPDPPERQGSPRAAERTEAAAAPRRRVGLRSVAFAITILLLVLAIPTLGFAGLHTIRRSRAGQVFDPVTNPRAPGYRAIVEPTPTALVVQRDAQGDPLGLTVLALGAGEAGGTVLFVPLDTKLINPAFYINTLRAAYTIDDDEGMVARTATLLTLGFGSVIDLDDDAWAQAVAPVAPLTIDNPDSVTTTTASFPAGRVVLEADDVGPYLAAGRSGESDLNRLVRHQIVWEAWLDAIAASTDPEPVPTTESGIGPFVRTLAAARSNIDTLDVVPAADVGSDGRQRFEPDPRGIRRQITDAVPFPVSPGLGSRYSVRLLNGANGDPIDPGIAYDLVYNGAQIDAIGNARRFGLQRTTIEYHSRARKAAAQQVALVLGGARLVYDARSTEAVDLIVVLGRDALRRRAAGRGSGGG